MNINSRQFIGSFNTLSELPEIDIPEFCFIGRSNVGKSSLINYLTGKNDLAKVSSTPGKTQSLNYFLINKIWHLVDLPGYGYAKRSKTLRSSWEKTMYTYFETREALVNIFLLIDSRIKPMKSDLDMINWLGRMVFLSLLFIQKRIPEN
jgi:GTP-binding protein